MNEPLANLGQPFFDEIDSIAGQRSDDAHEASKRVVAQLLTLGRIAATAPRALRPPMPVETLPVAVDPHHLSDAMRLDGEPWLLLVGIAEATLRPAVLRVFPICEYVRVLSRSVV